MNKFLCLGFVLAAGLSSPANADLRYCEGRWTNGNCGNAAVEAVMQEHRAAPEDEALASEKRKEALLQSLRLTLERTASVSKIPLDIEAERSQCMEPGVTVEQCTQLVLSKERVLRELAANYGEEAAAEREPEEERGPTQYITIINNNGFDDCFDGNCWDWNWNDNHWGRRDWKRDDWNSTEVWNNTEIDSTGWKGPPRAIPQMQPGGRAKLSLGQR